MVEEIRPEKLVSGNRSEVSTGSTPIGSVSGSPYILWERLVIFPFNVFDHSEKGFRVFKFSLWRGIKLLSLIKKDLIDLSHFVARLERNSWIFDIHLSIKKIT